MTALRIQTGGRYQTSPASLRGRWYPPKAKEKLGLGWTGPFKVLERIGESAGKIKKSNKVLAVHQNDIKPYEGREQPGSEGESETKKMESESESENGEENGMIVKMRVENRW